MGTASIAYKQHRRNEALRRRDPEAYAMDRYIDQVFLMIVLGTIFGGAAIFVLFVMAVVLL